MILAVLVGMVLALAIIIVFVGLRELIESQANAEQRLELTLARGNRAGAETQAGQETSHVVSRLDRLVSSRGFARNLSRELMQADLQLTISEYITIRVVATLLVAVVATYMAGNVGTGVLLGIVAFFVPRFYVARRRHNRLEAFNNQLEDVIRLLVGALRAGYSFLHALEVVVEELPPPASVEFRGVVREVGLGLSLQEAMLNLVHRMESNDLDLLVTAINIQHEVGGNLATILEQISETIRERVRIQGEIRTLTTQQRTTGYILSLLPFILGAIIYIINPTYILRLFEPGLVRVMPVTAVVLIGVGFLFIRKLVDIEV